MKILSIQIGKPKTFAPESPKKKEWISAIEKHSTAGPTQVHPEHLEGDSQANLKVHGGPDKAICVYPSEHYLRWKTDLDHEFSAGSFGENLTTQGLTETKACIGDTFQCGETILQITQPRQPCWKLARRWQIDDLPILVQNTGRTGWYFRILQTGYLQAGATFTLIDRPHPQWTVDAANQVMHHCKTDLAKASSLASCSALSQSWKITLEKRSSRCRETNSQDRLNPPNT